MISSRSARGTVASLRIACASADERRWSLGASAIYNRAHSFGNIIGNYGNVSGNLNVSRQLVHSFHAFMSFSANRYLSNTFSQYNREIYQARIGIGWSPGDIPLRVW